jgi:hypothetical protein
MQTFSKKAISLAEMNSSIKAQQEFTELKCKRTDDKGNGQ